MRIAHVISSLDPNAGGPPSVLWRLGAAQAALGHDVTAIGPRDPRRDDVIDDSRRAVPGIDDLRVIRTTAPTSAARWILDRQIPRALDDAGPFDVLHIHAVWEAPLVRAAQWARRLNVPYVIRPAGMLDVWSLEQAAPKKRFAMATTHRAFLRRAAAIHALNEHEQHTIEKLALGPRVVRIPNGVFLEEVALTGDPSLFRDAHPELADRPYAIFLSRLHYKKGLDILARAWAIAAPNLPEHRLVVAGPRQDDSIDDFRRQIAAAGLEDTVIETGAIYADTKAAALAGAECFVLPSRQEGFSVAITEALALGTPAVASRDCHFPEISEVGAGIETSLEPEDVAQALTRILQNDDQRRQAGQAAANLVRSRFTWPRIAQATLDLYASMIAPESPTPSSVPPDQPN